LPPSWCKCANVGCLNLGVQSRIGVNPSLNLLSPKTMNE
jgi:hypothetical protein